MKKLEMLKSFQLSKTEMKSISGAREVSYVMLAKPGAAGTADDPIYQCAKVVDRNSSTKIKFDSRFNDRCY